MASLSGNKGAGSTDTVATAVTKSTPAIKPVVSKDTNDKDQETGSKKTTTTTNDKDETYWVGVTIVAVAVVVVAALAGTLHCCLRRHDEATREEWKRK